MFDRSDERFVWNWHLGRAFTENHDFAQFLVPVVHGYIDVNAYCSIHRKDFAYTVIARRSRQRAGARYIARGADSDGKVANFVETEQLIEFNGDVCSFVQVVFQCYSFWHFKINFAIS